jgi:uncharacterized protein
VTIKGRTSEDQAMTTIELETSHGLARVHLGHPPADAPAALVLGHGAGGGVGAPDLVAASEAARAEGLAVALVEQPYLVAGRRTPPRAQQLDLVWISVLQQLRERELTGLPFVSGGRSLGARVACRTADEVDVVAVLCLAFPLLPPRRTGTPSTSRLPELDAVQVPTLVVQGERDPFGIPPSGPHREVRIVPGDHSLRAGLEEVRAAAGTWLRELFPTRQRSSGSASGER